MGDNHIEASGRCPLTPLPRPALAPPLFLPFDRCVNFDSFADNPQFYLRVPNGANTLIGKKIICLHTLLVAFRTRDSHPHTHTQTHTLLRAEVTQDLASGMVPIGVCVVDKGSETKVDVVYENEQVAASEAFTNTASMSLTAFLAAKEYPYVVVPSTFNPGLLRIVRIDMPRNLPVSFLFLCLCVFLGGGARPLVPSLLRSRMQTV